MTKTGWWKVSEVDDGWQWELMAPDGMVVARSAGYLPSEIRAHQEIGKLRHVLRDIDASVEGIDGYYA